MASANKVHHLAEDISATNIFGRCQPELLETTERERIQKEQKFKEEKILREAEALRQEIMRLEEEEDFKEFSEKERIAEAKRTTPPFCTTGFGRGRLLAMQPHVKKNVNQFCSGYFNTKTELLQTWGNRNIYEDKEDEEKEEEEEEEEGGEEEEIKNNPIYYQRGQFGVDSTFSDTSEEYSDAQSSVTPTTSSYNSFSPYSCESPSPVVDRQAQMGRRASPPGSKPARRNRLAARFTNNIEDEQDIIEGAASMNINQEPYVEEVVGKENVEVNHDQLAVLESTRWPLAKKTTTTRKVAGTSFKSLNPSQRVLTNNAVTPEQLAVYYSGSADVSNGFTLNVQEFPPLCKATK